MSTMPELTRDFIRAVLHTYDQRVRLHSYERIPVGVMNQVYALRLVDGSRLVLRYLDPPDGAAKALKELAAYRLLERAKIPVPELLFVSTTNGAGIILFEYLRGEMLRTALDSMPEDQRHQVYEAVGRVQARIHRITFDQFGDLHWQGSRINAGPLRLAEGTAEQGPFARWVDMFDALNHDHAAGLAGSEFEDLVPAMTAFIHRARAAIPDDCIPALLHMDYHSGNVFVYEGQVTGVLDVEGALIGHAEYGLVRTELAHFQDARAAYRDAFLRGYRAERQIHPHYDRLFPLYHMALLLARMRGMVDYERLHGPLLTTRKAETRQECLQLLAP